MINVKKLLAIVLSLALMLGAIPAFAADSDAETVLKEVKSRIEIPEDLTEFEYSKNIFGDNDTYSFYWNSEDSERSVNVFSDGKGRIESYYLYDREFYDDNKKKIVKTSENEAIAVAESFLEKTFPEMFENENDFLKLDESLTSSYMSGSGKEYTFNFKRMYNGLYVYENYVSVSVYAADEAVVTDAYSSIDYDTVFYEGEKQSLGEEDYKKEFPAKLSYKKIYTGGKSEVKLVYTIEKGFVSEKDGKKVEASDGERTYLSMGSAEASSADYSAEKVEIQLTPKEEEELESMNTLMSLQELEEKLRSIEELAVTDDMSVNYSNTYKSGDKYYTNMNLSDNENRALDVRFCASDGEILSLYNYCFSDDNTSENDSEAAIKFMEKLEPEKMKETEMSESDGTVKAYRVVNSVIYENNCISAAYENSMITSYRLTWDEDVSAFENPSNAIGEEKAYESALNETILEEVWLKQNDGYIPTITIGDTLTLEAASGKNMAEKSEKIDYTDIEGHWAENMINAIKEQDIYFSTDKFRPDDAITQGDAFRLFGSLFYYTSFARSDADYESLIKYRNVIKKDEADESKLITREEAFNMFVAMMGAGDVASLDIFKASFDDSTAFSGSIGSAEILKAMGIIIGNEARPNDNLTRAEAAVMVYRYLDR